MEGEKLNKRTIKTDISTGQENIASKHKEDSVENKNQEPKTPEAAE